MRADEVVHRLLVPEMLVLLGSHGKTGRGECISGVVLDTKMHQPSTRGARRLSFTGFGLTSAWLVMLRPAPTPTPVVPNLLPRQQAKYTSALKTVTTLCEATHYPDTQSMTSANGPLSFASLGGRLERAALGAAGIFAGWPGLARRRVPRGAFTSLSLPAELPSRGCEQCGSAVGR